MKGEVEFIHWASQRWMCMQEVATPWIRLDVLRGTSSRHLDAGGGAVVEFYSEDVRQDCLCPNCVVGYTRGPGQR